MKTSTAERWTPAARPATQPPGGKGATCSSTTPVIRRSHSADDQTYRAEGTECQACHGAQAEALRGQAGQLQVEPDPHFDRVACIDCHDMSVSRQSMASHAERCADCHNDQYAQLAYEWAQTFQQKRSAIERRARQRAEVPSDEIDVALSQAARSGFHHLHLTQQLYDRLLKKLEEADRATAIPQREEGDWTGR
jgi:hypothetical protein